MIARWILPILALGCGEYDLHGPPGVVPPGNGPALSVQPSALDFGEVALGEEAEQTVTVRNVGLGTLTLEPLALTDPSGTFTLTPLTITTLGADESTPFAVTFTPNAVGAASGAVTVASDAALDGVVDVTLAGEGLEPPPPPVQTYTIDIFLTADDAWDAWVDGVAQQGTNTTVWNYFDTLTLDLDSGDHVLAIHARDQASVISGLIAVVAVDGVDTWVTGDGSWRMTATQPPADWTDTAFDDSAWSPAVTCASQSTWGTYWPTPFYDRGASWVWWTDNCSDLQSAWFRLPISLP